MFEAWKGFKGTKWQKEIDVSDFIKNNYTQYIGDDSFLQSPTKDTLHLNSICKNLLILEQERGGAVDMDTEIPSSLTSHCAGYLDKDKEKIVGLQTDKPLKRAFFPYGGINVAVKAAEAYGYKVSDATKKIFTQYRKTHNQGVFDAYTQDIKNARSSHIVTGLPDGYGRGRIIGDYRRVALYGVDFLIEQKKIDREKSVSFLDEDKIREREENQEQLRALEDLKKLGDIYGFDISKPASNAAQAIQWLYFGYLGAVKEQNGAAMSLGRTSTFLDIYIERDLKAAKISEKEAQELIDQFIMKLRIVRFARTPEYNSLFTGDPTWVTESIGGMQKDNKRSLVTKTSFRYLQTLYNLDAAPEPNMTILWAKKLPENFKKFCAKVSIDTSSIQYENDDKMRPFHGDDYAIACCVSPMEVGKAMQFFGARANLAKALLYALNEGKDEISGKQIASPCEKIKTKVLDYKEVMKRYDKIMDWLAQTYADALNIIHYMHDKYAYERLQMALHDKQVKRYFATGIAGLSVVADSLSAIKYAKVFPIYDERGLIIDFKIRGDYPKYGNNDDRVDKIAISLVSKFMGKIRKCKTYRKSIPTMSVLTITSNVVYGKATGSTPDGRKYGEPFAPGANPMSGRDNTGALNSLMSVAKIPFQDCRDGISNTFTMIPTALGKEGISAQGIVHCGDIQTSNLIDILDGYFHKGGYHLNVNILRRDTLKDAYNHPEKYPNLTIRVSGYAVNFNKLTQEQQREVMSRTFHESA